MLFLNRKRFKTEEVEDEEVQTLEGDIEEPKFIDDIGESHTSSFEEAIISARNYVDGQGSRTSRWSPFVTRGRRIHKVNMFSPVYRPQFQQRPITEFWGRREQSAVPQGIGFVQPKPKRQRPVMTSQQRANYMKGFDAPLGLNNFGKMGTSAKRNETYLPVIGSIKKRKSAKKRKR